MCSQNALMDNFGFQKSVFKARLKWANLRDRKSWMILLYKMGGIFKIFHVANLEKKKAERSNRTRGQELEENICPGR